MGMNVASLPSHFAGLQLEFRQELIAIADWWVKNTIDHEQGGFYGEVAADNVPVKNASKGIILNSRILWFFSAAARELQVDEYRQAAQRAYDYITHCFFESKFANTCTIDRS